MDPQSFAAARRARMEASDELLLPAVTRGLSQYRAGEAQWMDTIADVAAQIWLENFEAEAPGRPFTRPLAAFRRRLEEVLELTGQPDEDDVLVAQATRIANWLSTYAVNAGTASGAFGRGIRYKRWTTMRDGSVRDSHEVLEGVVRPLGSTFDVAGTKLAYPGEPAGPPEAWINCRCVLMPASRDGEAMSATTYVIGPEDEVDENPDIVEGYDIVMAAASAPVDEELLEDVPEDDEEIITEIPVHGVLAPEGVPTGDGRMFALESLSTRDLPVPLLYEYVHSHGGDTSMSSTVGRVDEAWRDEGSNMWRWRGAIVLSTTYAQEAIDGMVNGLVRGVSIDGDAAEVEITVPEDGEDGLDLLALLNPGETVFSKMRVAGLTIVPIPAFQEAYIALGADFQEDLSEEDVAAQVAALQACGCLDGWDVVDLSESPEENARAALAAELFREEGAAEEERETLPEPVVLADVLTETFAPGTKDGPGWITHPVPTARIRRYWTAGAGAAKIRWGAPGDFNRCRAQLSKYVQNPDWLAGLCANMHYEALGFWPAQHHGSRVITAAGSRLASPAARLSPVESEVFPREWFQNPTLDHAVPLRIEKDTRRIYGYVAEWGTCHVGIAGFCQDVPRSYSDYSYFKKGLVETDSGEQSVGVISYGEGHASAYDRISVATAHYDQPKAVRAYVNVGEDEYGIWFAGVLAPWVSDADIAAMRAIGAVSGDWREIRGEYELIGVPVVNTPGYPLKATLAASAGRQVSLIGVGALRPEPAEVSLTFSLTDEMVKDIAAVAVSKMMHQQTLAARALPARAAVKRQRLAAARARLEGS